MNENAVAVVCKSLVDPAMQEKFKQVLPAGVDLDRFTRVTLTAIQQNPAILECDRQSLYNSCVNAAQRGLLPDGKEGALVSFNTKQGDGWIKKAQFLVMVEGVIKEMAKAGVKAYAVSIYANDQFEVWNDDDGQHFKHKPVVFGDRGARVGAVASGRDPDGRTWVEAMNMEDIERVKKRSKSPNGPWATDTERMEQKSVLHRLRKRIPILANDDVVERLQADEEADFDQTPPEERVVEPVAEGAKKRPRGLQAVINADVPREPIPETDFDQSQRDAEELF